MPHDDQTKPRRGRGRPTRNQECERVAFHLPSDIMTTVRVQAAKSRRTLTSIVEEALRNAFDKDNKKEMQTA
ncbi:hypothetical protein [Belnapia rosea]|uniref:Uncharacterized protein n=1 Tax=Belnapia rosea TaxID=938405 RepID=A0A1G7BT52_9PROT|nr:hypothetical protein [Belnapia rosea]SDE30288.1 hypothetical protein SAMN04487779_102716 [Belnapia rosea]